MPRGTLPTKQHHAIASPAEALEDKAASAPNPQALFKIRTNTAKVSPAIRFLNYLVSRQTVTSALLSVL